MKLLIVDDEELTRKGLLTSIDWKASGIQNVYLADDGVNGLSLAKLYKPEIILTDVRMPRMDGIVLARKIREEFPDTSIIFMSGYSDKEYLKAAIKLKAISYVEKPISTSDVEYAIKDAIENRITLEKAKQSSSLKKNTISSQLALKIVYQRSNSQDMDKHWEEDFAAIGHKLKPSTAFTTLIIKVAPSLLILTEQTISKWYLQFNEILNRKGFMCIYANKQNEYLIYHIFTNDRISPPAIRSICNNFAEILINSCSYYIVAGKAVSGVRNVYDSYNTAVILLQSTFFYDYNNILFYGQEHKQAGNIPSELLPRFTDALIGQDQEALLDMVDRIYECYKETQDYLPSYAKDIYYKLFAAIHDYAQAKHVNISQLHNNLDNIWDHVSGSNTLSELNEQLILVIESLFKTINETEPEKTTIFLIKSFIEKNYSNVNLSVKDISEHVYLTTSYVCTLFKNDTGKTLNQYITEFRIEKAKLLLTDPRFKITNISARVGYSDGNYFGKIFKKLVGVSPSDYRALHLKL